MHEILCMRDTPIWHAAGHPGWRLYQIGDINARGRRFIHHGSFTEVLVPVTMFTMGTGIVSHGFTMGTSPWVQSSRSSLIMLTRVAQWFRGVVPEFGARYCVWANASYCGASYCVWANVTYCGASYCVWTNASYCGASYCVWANATFRGPISQHAP